MGGESPPHRQNLSTRQGNCSRTKSLLGRASVRVPKGTGSTEVRQRYILLNNINNLIIYIIYKLQPPLGGRKFCVYSVHNVSIRGQHLPRRVDRACPRTFCVDKMKLSGGLYLYVLIFFEYPQKRQFLNKMYLLPIATLFIAIGSIPRWV